MNDTVETNHPLPAASISTPRPGFPGLPAGAPDPMDALRQIAAMRPRIEPMPAPIAAAIVAVCRSVRTLEHDGRNTHSGYTFASVDAFLAQVGAWCADAGLVILPEEIRAERIILDEWEDNQGRRKREYALSALYRFWLVHESGAMWMHPMERRIELRWDGPQAYGSAESYVLKRFMRALFKVPTGDALDPASDVADPDLRREGAPAARRASPPDDPLFGRPVDPPPGFTSATERPRRGAAPPPASPPVDELGPPQPVTLPPVNGEPPYRVFNALGEGVSEYGDLKTWGVGMKKHLTAYPASAEANRPEVARLRDFYLADDPDIDPRARLTLQKAFDSLDALLDPRPPAGSPPETLHDPQTGEVLEEHASSASAEEPNPYAS